MNVDFDDFGQIIPDASTEPADSSFSSAVGLNSPVQNYTEDAGFYGGGGFEDLPDGYEQLSLENRRRYRRWKIITSLLAVVLAIMGVIFWVVGYLNTPVSVQTTVSAPVTQTVAATTSAPKPSPTVATVAASELNKLYTDGKNALAGKLYQEAVTNFERLIKLQPQNLSAAHPDAVGLLFQAYVNMADTDWAVKDAPDHFRDGFDLYKKAQALLDGQSNQVDPVLQGHVATQLELANKYYEAHSVYETKAWSNASALLAALYTKNNDFQDVATLYYNTLVNLGDQQTSGNKLEEAYRAYTLAARLKNVSGGIQYAKLKADGLEEAFKQTNHPIPVVTGP